MTSTTFELLTNLLAPSEHLSNRKRSPCLRSLVWAREGLGEFETFMRARDEVEGLHN